MNFRKSSVKYDVAVKKEVGRSLNIYGTNSKAFCKGKIN